MDLKPDELELRFNDSLTDKLLANSIQRSDQASDSLLLPQERLLARTIFFIGCDTLMGLALKILKYIMLKKHWKMGKMRIYLYCRTSTQANCQEFQFWGCLSTKL